MAFVEGGKRLALLAQQRVVLLGPRADGEHPVLASSRITGFASYPVLDNRALLIKNETGWTVFTCAHDRLKRAGRTKADVRFDFDAEGHVYMQAAGQHFEFAGIADAVQRAAALSKKKTTKAKKRNTKAKKRNNP